MQYAGKLLLVDINNQLQFLINIIEDENGYRPKSTGRKTNIIYIYIDIYIYIYIYIYAKQLEPVFARTAYLWKKAISRCIETLYDLKNGSSISFIYLFIYFLQCHAKTAITTLDQPFLSKLFCTCLSRSCSRTPPAVLVAFVR